jgi:hypothetical protein
MFRGGQDKQLIYVSVQRIQRWTIRSYTAYRCTRECTHRCTSVVTQCVHEPTCLRGRRVLTLTQFVRIRFLWIGAKLLRVGSSQDTPTVNGHARGLRHLPTGA